MRERNLVKGKAGGARDDVDLLDEVRQLKERAAGLAEQVRQGAVSAARRAREQVTKTASELTHAVTDAVSDEATRLFDRQKSRAVSKVAWLGKSGRRVGHALRAVRFDAAADYLDAAAGRADEASHYLEDHDLTQAIEDLAELARRHRALAVGGLFLAGLALGRFIKATGSGGAGESDADAGRQRGRAGQAGGGHQGGSRNGAHGRPRQQQNRARGRARQTRGARG